MGVYKNPDLSIAYQRPGVYTYQSRQGAPPVADNRRVLFLSYKTAAGALDADTARRVYNEDDGVLGAGKGSHLVRLYRAFNSWVKEGAEVHFLPVTTPSGTARTRLLKVMAAPNGAALDAVTTAAAAATTLWVWVSGYLAAVQVAVGDTWEVIAANLEAELLKIEDFLPCTVARSTDTITLTMRHAAEASHDIPIRVRVGNATSKLGVSCGTLTLATNADADTTQSTGHTLLVTTQVAQYAPGNAETAANAAAGFITAINATRAYPVSAAQTGPSAVIRLFHRNDRDVNEITASTLDGAQTLTLACGAVAAGAPNLSAALASLTAMPAFRLIVTDLIDTTTLGTLSSHIEQQANGSGSGQKGQELIFVSTKRLSTAGAIPTGTSPALTASPRYFMGWCPGHPHQALEISARMAAEIVNNLDYPPRNYAGHVLGTSGGVPFLLPDEAVRPSDSDINAAMASYYMTPLVVNGSNMLAIESGRTTAKPSATLDGDYRWWGVQLADDFVRDDLAVSIPGIIKDKSLKAHGEPRTNNTIKPDGVRGAVYDRMLYYESLDIFDGAEGMRNALRAEQNEQPSRVDVEMPKRFPVPAEQVSIVTTKAVR